MFIEINLDPSIIEIINSKSFSNAIIIASSANLENKILLYADMRVAPSGIVNLKDRLDEVHLRHPKYVNNPDFSTLATAVEKIEQEIIGCEKKLNLPAFKDKAPPEVVVKEQEKLAQAKSLLKKRQSHLEMILSL